MGAGIGLKRAKATNKARSGKLAQRMLVQGYATLAKVIRLKYGFDEEGHVVFRHKHRSSLI